MSEQDFRADQDRGALALSLLENELLKEAVEYGRQKKWIAHVPLLPEDGE